MNPEARFLVDLAAAGIVSVFLGLWIGLAFLVGLVAARITPW